MSGVFWYLYKGAVPNINKDTKGVPYEGTACSAMEAGEIELP